MNAISKNQTNNLINYIFSHILIFNLYLFLILCILSYACFFKNNWRRLSLDISNTVSYKKAEKINWSIFPINRNKK